MLRSSLHFLDCFTRVAVFPSMLRKPRALGWLRKARMSHLNTSKWAIRPPFRYMRRKNRIKHLFRLLTNAMITLRFLHKCKGTQHICQALCLKVRKLKIKPQHLRSRTWLHAHSTTWLHLSKRKPISSHSMMLKSRKFSPNTSIPSQNGICIKFIQVRSNNGRTG